MTYCVRSPLERFTQRRRARRKSAPFTVAMYPICTGATPGARPGSQATSVDRNQDSGSDAAASSCRRCPELWSAASARESSPTCVAIRRLGTSRTDASHHDISKHWSAVRQHWESVGWLRKHQCTGIWVRSEQDSQMLPDQYRILSLALT